MASKRYIYKQTPLYGLMTQGCIINGCTSESFPNNEVFGLIITPRCDLGHEGKVLTVHYVPIIPFELWFNDIAKPIIKKQWKRELANKLNNDFSAAKAGNKIMDADFSYEDMMKVFEHKINTKPTAKQKIKENLDAFFDKDPDAFNFYLLDETKRGHKKTDFLSDLIGDKNHSYYLIEDWVEDTNSHYVIMLRDVRRIEYSVAQKIKNGIQEAELGLADTTHNDLFLTGNEEHFLSVQALINSPFIEHIMQSFVYNFSRIGVEDRYGETLNYLDNTIKSII